MQRNLSLILIAIFLIGCAGVKPQPDWTAEQYFQYAKKKFNDGDYYEASNEFTVVVLRYAGSTIADSAQYYLAQSHYLMDEFLIAAVEFEKLINNMSRSSLVPLAQYKLAECYFQLSPRPSLDQSYTDKAIRAYQRFIEENPTHELKEEAQKKIGLLRDKLAEKLLKNARLYVNMREYEAALIYYDEILQNYYDSKWSDDAQFDKINIYIDMEQPEQARLEIVKFKQQFPRSPYMEEVNSLFEYLAEETNDE